MLALTSIQRYVQEEKKKEIVRLLCLKKSPQYELTSLML
jgi:hypothetical protein